MVYNFISYAYIKKTQRSATFVVTLRGLHYFSLDHTTSLPTGKENELLIH